MKILDEVLSGLMTRYRLRVPEVEAVISTMLKNGLISKPEDIENDHIAFRTMGVPQLGIRSLEKIFLHLGYTKRDRYYFPEKKLNAFWYAPPSENYPRIFISELKVEDLSPAAQAIIKKYTDEVTADPVDSLDLNDAAVIDRFLHSALWRSPDLEDFLLLSQESEYAAWVIYNRYYLNHFTVSVHNLPDGYNTCVEFNQFLESNGFKLNDAGGKVKTSPDGLLSQSSTVAGKIKAEFAGGKTYKIAGSYVEFAERKILPEF
ncbi:MAG TPA: DUF1338 domain-containing protein, partial [Parasegetibacter sp.]